MRLTPFSRSCTRIVLALGMVCGVGRAQLFQQPTIVPADSWPAAIFAADLRGNGSQDLLYVDAGATSSSSTTHVLLNDGKGNFTPMAATVATAGTSIVAADMVKGDAVDLEWVAVSGHTGSVYLARGNGDGTFATPVLLTSFPISGANAPSLQLAFTNYQQDLHRSLLIEDVANAELYEAFGNPDGTYAMYPVSGQPGIALIAGANEMIAQDINGDGVTDLLVQGTSGVEVFLGEAAGTAETQFPSPVKYPCAGNVTSILLYDIDNDGLPDLTAAGVNGSYNVYHGNANGTFDTASEGGTATQGLDGTTGYGGYLIGATTVGPSGETRRHYYAANPAGISVLLGNGHVQYSLNGIYDLGPGRTSFAFADFNGDGYPDVAVDSPLGIVIGFGQADNSLKAPPAFAPGQPAYGVTTGKFAGTQHVDAIVATGLPQVQLMNGDGAGNFSVEVPAAPTGTGETNAGRTLWSSVLTGDFDGDGKPDAALSWEGYASDSASTQGLSIAFGSGSYGSIGSPAQGFPGPGIGSIAVGDFNADGVSDILSFDGTNAAIYLGGAATHNGEMPRQILFTDAGGEPKFDLVAAGFLDAGRTSAQDVVVQDGSEFRVFLNNGSGTFTQVNTITPAVAFGAPVNGVLPAAGYFPGSMTLADLDGDGFGDLVIAYGNLAANAMNPGANTALIYVYWGEGNGNFGSTPLVIQAKRNFYQTLVANLSGAATSQLVSTDGTMIDVLPFEGRVPQTAGEMEYLAGQGINSIAATDVNGDGFPDLVAANGGAVVTNPVANHGVLASNPVVDGGGLSVLLNQRVALPVTMTVAATPNPVLYADDFTLTATVVQPSGDAAATGTVTFSVDGTAVGTASVTNGVATLPVTAIPYSAGPPIVTGYIVGPHAVTAVYSGDSNYLGQTASTTLEVNGQPTVSMVVDLDQNLYYGQEIGYDYGVDAELEVDAVNPGATSAPLTGTLTVTVNGNVVCQTTEGVSQRCPDPPFEGFDALPNGSSYTLAQSYSGDSYYAPSSVSYPVYIVADPTSIAVTSSASPSSYGQSVTFTATVTAEYASVVDPQYATPVGSVTFFDGTTAIGTAAVSAQGTATVSLSTLTSGVHSITAQFAAPLNAEGAVNFGPSVSAALPQTVSVPPPQAAATVTVLQSSLNPSVVGQSVTFTASVASTGAFVTLPAGAVQFLDGSTVIGTGTLDANGSASFSTSSLSAGLHTMTAVYAGNTATAASTSAKLLQQVNVALVSAGNGFVLQVSPTAVTVGAGNYAVLTVTVTDLNQFNQAVTLSCGGLPNEAGCKFGTATIPAGGGVTSLEVTAAAPHSCGTSAPYFVASSGERGWLGLLGAAVLVVFARRRKLGKGMLMVTMLGVLAAISGCGNCTDLGTKPGSYSFTVTGTAAGGSVLTTPGGVNETQTVVVPMTVVI